MNKYIYKLIIYNLQFSIIMLYNYIIVRLIILYMYIIICYMHNIWYLHTRNIYVIYTLCDLYTISMLYIYLFLLYNYIKNDLRYMLYIYYYLINICIFINIKCHKVPNLSPLLKEASRKKMLTQGFSSESKREGKLAGDKESLRYKWEVLQGRDVQDLGARRH